VKRGDDDIALGLLAVREGEHCAVRRLHDGRHARVEPNAFRRQRILQHRVQIGAMRAKIAGAVLRTEHAAHLRRRDDAAGLPVAHDVAMRLERNRLELAVEAERHQHAHGVRA
jgi:hypothetical protein